MRRQSAETTHEVFRDPAVSARFLRSIEAESSSADARRLALDRLGSLPRDAVVVDMGAGGNLLAAEMTRLGFRNVAGLDRHAPATLPERGRANYFPGAMESAPPPALAQWLDARGGKADAVTFLMSLGWGTAQDQGAYLGRAAAMLRPGGKLVVVEPAGAATTDSLQRLYAQAATAGLRFARHTLTMRDGAPLVAIEFRREG